MVGVQFCINLRAVQTICHNQANQNVSIDGAHPHGLSLLRTVDDPHVLARPSNADIQCLEICTNASMTDWIKARSRLTLVAIGKGVQNDAPLVESDTGVLKKVVEQDL